MLFKKYGVKLFIIVTAVNMIFASVQVFGRSLERQNTENRNAVYLPVPTAVQEIKSQEPTLHDNCAEDKPFFRRDEPNSVWGCNLGGKHAKMTGKLFGDNLGALKVVHLDIYGDEKFLKSYTLKADGESISVNIDVTGVKKLSVISDHKFNVNINISWDEEVSDKDEADLDMAFLIENYRVKFGDLTISNSDINSGNASDDTKNVPDSNSIVVKKDVDKFALKLIDTNIKPFLPYMTPASVKKAVDIYAKKSGDTKLAKALKEEYAGKGKNTDTNKKLTRGDVDKHALNVMELTANWGYVKPLFPYMTPEAIEQVVSIYIQSTGNYETAKEAASYIGKEIGTISADTD